MLDVLTLLWLNAFTFGMQSHATGRDSSTSSSFRRELLSTEARCSRVTLYYRVSHDTGHPEIWLSPRHHVYKGPVT